jgi:hypothetical protein
MADTVSIERQCNMCGTTHVLTVTGMGFAAWNMGRGEAAQDAFPELSDDERELLVGGTCPACTRRMFGDGTPEAPATLPGSGLPSWLVARIDQYEAAKADTGATPGTDQAANPGVPGVTPTQCVERALQGLTAEGEPATRGHLRAPLMDWPRCTTELPALYSPVFETAPKLCNRPATLLMAFTEGYVRSMAEHTCEDPRCPISSAGLDPKVAAHMLAYHVPLCAMHLPLLNATAASWVAEVGGKIGVHETFALAVIGVETVSLFGGGHPEGAQVLDLRPITGAVFPEAHS